MTHLRDVLDVLRELQRRLPALLLLAGLDALGVAYAACDYETLRGDWLLQGSGQTGFEGEACLAAARMEVQGEAKSRSGIFRLTVLGAGSVIPKLPRRAGATL